MTLPAIMSHLPRPVERVSVHALDRYRQNDRVTKARRRRNGHADVHLKFVAETGRVLGVPTVARDQSGSGVCAKYTVTDGETTVLCIAPILPGGALGLATIVTTLGGRDR